MRPGKCKGIQDVVDLIWIVRSSRRHDGIIRTAATSSGMISGVGFAKAKISGLAAIFATIFPETIPALDKPRNTSAPTKASPNSFWNIASKFALYCSTHPHLSALGHDAA